MRTQNFFLGSFSYKVKIYKVQKCKNVKEFIRIHKNSVSERTARFRLPKDLDLIEHLHLNLPSRVWNLSPLYNATLKKKTERIGTWDWKNVTPVKTEGSGGHLPLIQITLRCWTTGRWDDSFKVTQGRVTQGRQAPGNRCNDWFTFTGATVGFTVGFTSQREVGWKMGGSQKYTEYTGDISVLRPFSGCPS